MKRAVLGSVLPVGSLGFADKPLPARPHHRSMACNLYIDRDHKSGPWPDRWFSTRLQCLGSLSDTPPAAMLSQVSVPTVHGGERSLAEVFSDTVTWRAQGDAGGTLNERPGEGVNPPSRCAIEPFRARQAASGHGEAEPLRVRSRMGSTAHPRRLAATLPAMMPTAVSCERSHQSAGRRAASRALIKAGTPPASGRTRQSGQSVR
jgi:hypothetical protein